MVYVGCQCGHFFKIPTAQAGKSVQCPHCQQLIHLVATRLDPSIADTAACLICTKGPKDAGIQFFLAGDGPILIGKSRERDLRLADPMVSRLHCKLIRLRKGWRIEDANSTNGVMVNGTKVGVHDLRDGDTIELGDTLLKYVTPMCPTVVDANGAGPGAVPEAEESERESGGDAFSKSLEVFEDSGLLSLTDEDADCSRTSSKPAVGRPSNPPDEQYPAGPTCPSCGRVLRIGTLICTDCGVNVKTGRALLTSLETGIDEVYAAAEQVTRWFSWIVPSGVFPLASEAFGTRKPYVAWAIAAVTTLVSAWFLVPMYSRSQGDGSWLRLALWSGRVQPGQVDVSQLPPKEQAKLVQSGSAVWPYHPYQLLTHTLLHGDIMHLVGNLVFLLVFGSRVNALIGQPLTMIVYLLLAVLAGLADMASNVHGPCRGTIGASGAIMGLAGMYFVFFPLNKVHMLIWFRFLFFLRYKLFALRGFWVVIFYIGLDVLSTVRRYDDGVAHWAYLGGFIFGMAFAVLLMMVRLVNAHGSDILSAIFGRYAWGLIGSPGRAR